MSNEYFNGKMIIITAPSGAGKTTIVKHLKEKYPKMQFSVSATTRDKRKGELHGKDYFYLSIPEFKKLIDTKQLLEWEEVYENQYYGTLKSEVNRIWSEGKHILFDIDVKGATTLKERYGDRALSIFIKPPSLQVLMKRLKNRGSETPEQLKKRTIKLKEELSYETAFDVVIVNNDLQEALTTAENLVGDFIGNLSGAKA
nr:guanylate kinase [Saprospiraceae bacterium]